MRGLDIGRDRIIDAMTPTEIALASHIYFGSAAVLARNDGNSHDARVLAGHARVCLFRWMAAVAIRNKPSEGAKS